MIEITGRPASPGIAEGPLLALQRPQARARRIQAPRDEAGIFASALKVATAGLAKIADMAEDDAAAMLEFQIAMLEDEELTGPVLAAISAGASAEAAWNQSMGAQIADYEAADDDYFRARAADLTDIADRVLTAIGGGSGYTGRPGAILIGENITPSQLLATDWEAGGGIATGAGSPSSHAAMLARAGGVPMVVGLGPFDIKGHARAVIDGAAGTLTLSPGAAAMARFDLMKTDLARTADAEFEARSKPAVTACGTAIDVMVNISGTGDLDRLDPSFTDGLGLVRTEFLFNDAASLTDEERQYRAYRRIIAWAKGAPVTIRTIDAGGDKPIPGYTEAGESDPFLGLRGVRLSLSKPEIFRVQLRALARAAALGPLKIMLPMVTAPGEILAARAHLEAVVAELAAAGIDHGLPQLGMMIEVPATALTCADFAVDFASIGSNDLVQYLTAAARDNADVSGVCDPGHRAVEIAIGAAVQGAQKAGFDISICGDMAGEPQYLTMLLGAGLRSISVAIPALGRIKRAIAALDLGALAP